MSLPKCLWSSDWLRAGSVALLLASGACADDVPSVTTTGETESASTGDGPTTSMTTVDPDSTGVATTSQTGDTTEGPSESSGSESSESSSSDGSTGPGPVCGDGIADAGEDCDGDDLAGGDCEGLGFTGGTVVCADDCTFDTSGCTNRLCGNDVMEGAEECDGTDVGGETCETQGFDGGTLGCADDCSLDTTGCISFMCGNGMVEGVEACDGADLDGETCVSQGFMGGTLGCTPGCAFDTSGCTNEVCGNDVIEGAEVCDGADLGGQDCTTQGFDGGALGCMGDCSNYDTSGCANFGGDCCAANGTPGCDDPGCTNAICAADPFCCDTQWDNICANAATADPACQGVGGSCPGGGGGGDCCAANGTPGCDDPGCEAAICAVDPFCCNTEWDMVCANAANVEPACNGVGGSCPGGGGGGDCCAANGTPGCDDPGCEASICAVDPFCCNTEWDMVCANAANMDPNCEGVGGSCPAGGGSGDCCAPNGTPGCDDPGCEASVCAADPFCCDTLWDVACANQAIADPNCDGVGGSCPGGPAGDCCAANGSPGCDDPGCEASVCLGDPFCCDTEWDAQCANEAIADPNCDGVGGSCPGGGGFACSDTDIGSSTGPAVAMGNTAGSDDDLNGSCGGAGGNDQVMIFTAPAAGMFTFDTFGSAYDTKLSLFADCATELSCNDDAGAGLQSQLVLNMAAGQVVLVVVDGFNGATGPWVLNITQS